MESSTSNLFSNESNSRKFSEDLPTSNILPAENTGSNSSEKFSESLTWEPQNQFGDKSSGNDNPSRSIFNDFPKADEENSSQESFPTEIEHFPEPPSDDSDLSFETLLRIEKQNLRKS